MFVLYRTDILMSILFHLKIEQIFGIYVCFLNFFLLYYIYTQFERGFYIWQPVKLAQSKEKF